MSSRSVAGMRRESVGATPPRTWLQVARNGNRLARANVTLLLPVAVTAFFFVRCLSIARFDTTVARQLAALTTPSDALLGVGRDIFPAAVGTLALFIFAVTGDLFRERGFKQVKAYLSLLLASGLLCLTLFSDVGIDLPLAMVAGFVGISLTFMKRQEVPGRPPDSALMFVAVTLLLLAGASLRQFPWQPPERFLVAGHAFTGYTLDESGDDLLILLDKPRVVRRIPLKDVLERQFCREGTVAQAGQGLAPNTGGARSLPQCPLEAARL